MTAGDFVCIPAGVAHVPINFDPSQPAEAIISRTDPNEQESVVLLPELDGLAHLEARPAPVGTGLADAGPVADADSGW